MAWEDPVPCSRISAEGGVPYRSLDRNHGLTMIAGIDALVDEMNRATENFTPYSAACPCAHRETLLRWWMLRSARKALRKVSVRRR